MKFVRASSRQARTQRLSGARLLQLPLGSMLIGIERVQG